MVKKNINVAIFVPKNNATIVSVISLMLLFILVLYLVPSLFVSLFDTILGNLFLICIVFGVGYYHFISGVILAFGLVLFYQISHLTYASLREKKEGFLNSVENVNMELASPDGAAGGPWPTELVEKFIKFQKVLNPNLVYDMKIVQKQATPQEVEYLFKNNMWPWSKKTQDLYQASVAQNLYISIDPGTSMNDAQTVYNEMAVVELLSFQTKEGKFLINGATIGHTKDMPENINNVAVCSIDSKGNSILNKVLYTGYDGLDGHMIENITPVENKDIPSLVNGFKFLKSECNPCLALNRPSDYSCPFSLNVGDGGDVSSVWKMLWGMSPSDFGDGSSGPPSSSSSPFGSKNEFPLLTDLHSELGKLPFLKIKNEIGVGDFSKKSIAFNSSGPTSMSSSPASTSSPSSITGENITSSLPTSSSSVTGIAVD